MINAFLKYISDNKLASKNNRILLAVSGGIDSMVMADLFIRGGFNTGIAHCNFCLRGSESDKDELFVKEYAIKNKVPFWSVRFDTISYAENKGVSIQMAARDLRYDWFEKIMIENQFDCVAVAHNMNDNAETILINLTRGTGVAGLAGIRSANNNIIRPLLFAARSQIELYSKESNIKFREDISNSETKYTRNKIRHQVLPVLKKINPDILITLNETAFRMRDVNEIVNNYIESVRKCCFRGQEKDTVADIGKLKKYSWNRTILFELFRPYGITESTVGDLKNIIKGRTGSMILTSGFRIYKNRREIIISCRTSEQEDTYVIKSLSDLESVPLFESVKKVVISKKFRIQSDQKTASLDMELVRFPGVIRRWNPGDFFFPLGMKGKKKLSDYFIDKKYSRIKKERIFILEFSGEIAWIIGERIDDRFRITDSTNKALIIKSF